jgi:hypothetical protein
MGKRILLALTLLLAAIASAAVPLAASAEGMRPLVIGARFSLETGTGTFSACCAVSDSGTASLAITSFEVRGNEGVFEATNTFTGQDGSFTISIHGTTGPLTIDGPENPRHIARGEVADHLGDGQLRRPPGSRRPHCHVRLRGRNADGDRRRQGEAAVRLNLDCAG